MPEKTYNSISEAISNAPEAPHASIYEMSITGTNGVSEIKRCIAQAKAKNLHVEIIASPSTLGSLGLQDQADLDGTRIVSGATSTFDLVRFKFHR